MLTYYRGNKGPIYVSEDELIELHALTMSQPQISTKVQAFVQLAFAAAKRWV
jgi:hypothetical protein